MASRNVDCHTGYALPFCLVLSMAVILASLLVAQSVSADRALDSLLSRLRRKLLPAHSVQRWEVDGAASGSSLALSPPDSSMHSFVFRRGLRLAHDTSLSSPYWAALFANAKDTPCSRGSDGEALSFSSCQPEDLGENVSEPLFASASAIDARTWRIAVGPAGAVRTVAISASARVLNLTIELEENSAAEIIAAGDIEIGSLRVVGTRGSLLLHSSFGRIVVNDLVGNASHCAENPVRADSVRLRLEGRHGVEVKGPERYSEPVFAGCPARRSRYWPSIVRLGRITAG